MYSCILIATNVFDKCVLFHFKLSLLYLNLNVCYV